MKPPTCDEICTRAHSCSHVVMHHCHSDQHCPPCTALTEKWCHGQHELRKSVACHIDGISCGRPCDKVHYSIITLFHYSHYSHYCIIALFHYTIIPLFHYSRHCHVAHISAPNLAMLEIVTWCVTSLAKKYENPGT